MSPGRAAPRRNPLGINPQLFRMGAYPAQSRLPVFHTVKRGGLMATLHTIFRRDCHHATLGQVLALRIKLSWRAPYPTSAKEKDDGRLRLCSLGYELGNEKYEGSGNMPAHILVEFARTRIISPTRHRGKEKGEENCK